MPQVCTEDELVEQPVMGLLAAHPPEHDRGRAGEPPGKTDHACGRSTGSVDLSGESRNIRENMNTATKSTRDDAKPLHKCLLPVLSLLLLSVAACQNANTALIKGGEALRTRNYDDAAEYADEVLATTASGPVRSEALYLRGRAFEERSAEGAGELASNLLTARLAYVEALRNSPTPKLQTYIHTSMGKVAFFQEDYPAAERELLQAYSTAGSDDNRMAILFFLARSRQRLGRFFEADQNFATLIHDYPNTDWANKANEVRGARAFYVQLGAYSSIANADAAAVAVRRRGVSPIRLVDSKGRQLLRVGPCASYAQASTLRGRLADAYPGALILP